MKHFVIVGVLVAIVTVVVTVLLEGIGLLPVQASAQAVPIDRLFGLHVRVIAFLFALIVVFMLYSIIVFRRRPGDTGDGDHFEGHTGLEIAWTIIPLGIVLYFAYIGAQALAETRRVDPQAMQVNVTGSQWAWKFEYPELGVTSNTLNLPINRQVLLKMSSTDVIHSFWVPEFRVKQDVLPGADMVKELRITPTLLGQYKVRCAELCGTAHSTMENPVVVLDQAAFDAWVTEQTKVSDDPVVRGQKIATQTGCLGCHAIDDKVVVGPSWKGIYGEQVTLADGTTVTVDDAYLKQAILDPNSQVVKGFNPNIMPPSYAQLLSEAQISDIIAFIKSVK